MTLPTRMICVYILCILAAISSTCSAAGKAELAKFDSFWKSKSPVTVPVTVDQAGIAQFQFPALPIKKGEVPVLRFKAYLKTPSCAGWSHYIKLNINGKALGADVDGGRSRLINRERIMSYKDDSLVTFFGPGGDAVDSRLDADRQEGCWYLLDISDAANKLVIGWDDRIESQEPNKFSIANTYKLLSYGETAACKEFVVENLEVGYLPESIVNELRGVEFVHMDPASGPSIASGNTKLTAGKDGALEFTVAGESYYFASLYSHPDKVAMQYNGMGLPSRSASDWKMTTSKRKSQIKVTGECKDYSIIRTISPDGGRFHIKDKITNRTDKPLGMAIRYNAITNQRFTGDNVFLCGSNTQVGTENCGTNPSIFIKQSKSSIGLAVEDSLFRLQMKVTRKENSAEFATEHFGLEPQKSYTLEWTVYPSMSTDYWDFVNNVRQDWKVNYTILGPCPFGDQSAVSGRKGLLYAMNPWFDYENGKALTGEQYSAIVGPKVRKLLAEQPNAIPMGMLNTNLVPYDTSETGRIIPAGTMNLPDKDRTGYGRELNAEQTECLKKSPWWDSVIKTADGRGVIDTYYAPAPYCNLMVYPVTGNSQLKFMLWEVDLLMDRSGMKGVYMDQFNLAGITMRQPGRCDYSKWDGHTVDLKPNGEIDRMYTDGTLAGGPARAEILRYILKKGGVPMINGHPVDMETGRLPVQAFAETEWDLSDPNDLLTWKEPPYLPAIAEGQLSSPISLGIRPSRFAEFGKAHWAEIIQKWVIACLKNGSLYYYYENRIPTDGPGAGEYGIINHMFPFTPVELHAGWLIGRERILTAKSGKFFWSHPEKPVVLTFDSKGHKIEPRQLAIVKKGEGWDVDLAIEDWQNTAVIENGFEQ